jgi:hypothetical protein
MDWWTPQKASVWSSQFVDQDLNSGRLKYEVMRLHLRVILKLFTTIQHQVCWRIWCSQGSHYKQYCHLACDTV